MAPAAIGSDNELYHKAYEGTWHDWKMVGGVPLSSGPAAVSWGLHCIEVLAA